MNNEQLVHALYTAMNGRDVDAVAALTDPELTWVSDPRTGQGAATGRDEVLRFFFDMSEMFGSMTVEVEATHGRDDLVVAFILVTGAGTASGVTVEIRIAHLWTLRDGLVLHGRGYGDRDEALRAAGLG